MLKVNCTACREEINQHAALLFGPPNDEDQTTKYHLCISCFMIVENLITGYTVGGQVLSNKNGKPQLVVLRRNVADNALKHCPAGWTKQSVTVQL